MVILYREMKRVLKTVGAALFVLIIGSAWIAVGSEDQAYRGAGSQRLAREIPGAHLTVLEHAGHMLQFTRPDELTALVDAAAASGR